VALDLGEVPWGTVVVRLGDGALPAGGARVSLEGGRALSFLPGLSPEVRFPHVEAGDVRVEVVWAGEAATCLLAGRVEAGGETVLRARADPGGFVELLGEGPGLATDDEDRVLAFGPDDTPWRGVAHRLVAKRQRASARWRVAERLPAGPWRFEAVKPSTGGGQQVAVEVVAGATATAPLEVP
jgi:hypothetical protein